MKNELTSKASRRQTLSYQKDFFKILSLVLGLDRSNGNFRILHNQNVLLYYPCNKKRCNRIYSTKRVKQREKQKQSIGPRKRPSFPFMFRDGQKFVLEYKQEFWIYF